MYVAIWRYRVEASRREAFEQAYGPDGDWARLFARSDFYLGTELLCGEPGSDGFTSYVTLDRWRSETGWLRFRAEHGEAYLALDEECEALTADEERVGAFTQLS